MPKILLTLAFVGLMTLIFYHPTPTDWEAFEREHQLIGLPEAQPPKEGPVRAHLNEETTTKFNNGREIYSIVEP